MAHDFKIRTATTPEGKTAYYAKLANSTEKEFVIGYKTKYRDRFGLYNLSVLANLKYKAVDYEPKFGFWANFIEPTAKAESNGSFICLNTYDRAFFTFGLMQFAAHVPNGDFILLFKQLLMLPAAKDYFPKLELNNNNRICYKNNSGTSTQLESNESTQLLMEYFNPTTKEVENQELICSARMIHWATNSAEHRKIQVSHSINLYKGNMVRYGNRFSLNGFPAKVCFMICDILHQGRGTYDEISRCIDTGSNFEKAYSNLLGIGDHLYKDRIATLKTKIKSMEDSGVFKKKYNQAENAFK